MILMNAGGWVSGWWCERVEITGDTIISAVARSLQESGGVIHERIM